jgi:predicted ATPase
MTEIAEAEEVAVGGPVARTEIRRVHLTNFLSYRAAVLELNGFVALVGTNASGKSNAVAAVKLLRDIPTYGLPSAVARRGGFDALRHRSQGHPYDPAIRIDFRLGGADVDSYYELRLRTVGGKRYEIKSERAEVYDSDSSYYAFQHSGGTAHIREVVPAPLGSGGDEDAVFTGDVRVPPGQSALSSPGGYAAYRVTEVLRRIQTVEINTALVSELQDPSSTDSFEPDGSNTATIFEALSASEREAVTDELRAIVPGMDRIEVRRFADKVTLAFFQSVGTKTRREFFAKQMSDGTLRAFAIVLALHQPRRPIITVIEEPEIAIHLAALRTLVDILHQQADESQVLITTHSADIVDSLDVEALRVVWPERGASQIAPVAAHTKSTVTKGLITPGELLRANALDPATL